MGWLVITDSETGECLLEVGVRPIYHEMDTEICPHSGMGVSAKPRPIYREYVKEGYLEEEE